MWNAVKTRLLRLLGSAPQPTSLPHTSNVIPLPRASQAPRAHAELRKADEAVGDTGAVHLAEVASALAKKG